MPALKLTTSSNKVKLLTAISCIAGQLGLTLLCQAAYEGASGIVSELVDRGANVNVRSSFKKFSVLHWAVMVRATCTAMP